MKTLYFVAGVPSAAQKTFAKNNHAVIRNSLAHFPGDFLEQCDRVMGDIPSDYRDHKDFPEHEKHKEAVALNGQVEEVKEPVVDGKESKTDDKTNPPKTPTPKNGTTK